MAKPQLDMHKVDDKIVIRLIIGAGRLLSAVCWSREAVIGTGRGQQKSRSAPSEPWRQIEVPITTQ